MIRAFLREGEEELHDQVYDAVRAEIDQKRQRAFIGPWRLPTMNKIVTIGLGAAAAVVLAAVLINVLPGSGLRFGGEPSAEPTPTAQPSVAEPASSADASLPGPFSFEPDGPFSPNLSGMTVTVTIPASGWSFDPTWNLLGLPGEVDPFIAFWAYPDEQFYVPADACRADSTRPATPATTVD
jgi:hypothetical protein